MKSNSYVFFKILSNQTRWKILKSLYDNKKYVNEISKDINEEQSKVSHNLKLLSNCNVVFYSKEGKKRKYEINKETIKPLIDIVDKHVCTFCSKKNKKCICKK